MNRTLLFFIILSFITSLSFSKERNLDTKNVLIVSDKDGLEWNVANFLETHYTDEGFEVANILVSDYTKKEKVEHDVVILLSVIKHDKIPSNISEKLPQEKSYASDKPRDKHETIFFISTITGDEWDKDKRMIDGVTSASEMDDAEPIAKRIIEKISKKLTIQ